MPVSYVCGSVLLLVGFLQLLVRYAQWLRIDSYRKLVAGYPGATLAEEEFLGRDACTASIPLDGTMATITDAGSGKGQRTEVSFDVRELNPQGLRISIRPQMNLFGVPLPGAQDVSLGVPAFDEQYTIGASDEGAVRELLDADGRDLVMKLRGLEDGWGVVITLDACRLTVSGRGRLPSHAMAALLEGARALRKHAVAFLAARLPPRSAAEPPPLPNA